MKALILDAPNRTASVRESSRPKPRPGEVLVKVEAIALNPVDAIYTVHPLGTSGRTVGSDFAGTVVESRCPEVLKPGQRVAGFVQGACSANDRPGAFAEYLACPADLVWRIPDSSILEEAAAVSLCGLTAAQAIFYRLGLPAPFKWSGVIEAVPTSPHNENNGPLRVLIYGASTSVGMYAAQLVHLSAKASGRAVRLIGAASKARFPLLQPNPYSYDALVDYREDDWPEQVRSVSGGDGVDYAFDCISEGPTVRLVSSTLRAGGRVAIVRSRQGGAWNDEGQELPMEPIYGAVWEGLGVEIQYQGFIVPASESARSFAATFYR